MRILVTGGAGYVGSTLVPALLQAGHAVRVLDSLLHGGTPLLPSWNHPCFEFRLGDVRDAQAVRESLEGMEAVVHLAAIVGDPACARQPDAAKAVNRDASLDLIRQARRAGIERFLFASTCSNYGKMAGSSTYVDEHSELRPVSLYAETKVQVEADLLDNPRDSEMCTVPLRFATVFGVSPRMRFDLTINEFTMALLTRNHLVVYGEQFWRPYIHVTDVARAILTVLAAERHAVDRQVFNVGSTGENYRKQDLVEILRPHAPAGVVEYVHVNEDPRDYRVSFAKIAEQLGFRTTRTAAQGVAEVARLVRSGIITRFDEPHYRN